MAVQAMDRDQVLPIESHLDLALGLDPEEVEAIRTLAGQLGGKRILPILGAGASHDCGVRVAGKIAVDLHAHCSDNGLAEQLETVAERDLGGIAEAIYVFNGNSHQSVLEAIGMPETDQWPGTPDVAPHFCALRILARAIREHPYLEGAFSFNYDCCGEAAMRSEGFSLKKQKTAGLLWLDHVDPICSKEAYQDPTGRDGFELVKAHGCAEHYREAYLEDECEEVAEAIVIRTEQIATWKERVWAQKALGDRVQNHILLLVGFSGQDPATAKELKEVLEDIYSGSSDPGRPRLVVVDHEPDTDALRELIGLGVGPAGPEEGTVTKICTANSSTTAVLLVLLAEMIARELQPAMEELGFALPSELDTRLGLLTLVGPAMARWSFLLGGGDPQAFMQRINAGMEEFDYVPLRYEPHVAVRAFKIRQEMREGFGLSEPEQAPLLCGTDGFILHENRAYLPLGIDLARAKAACLGGAGSTLEQVKEILPWPEGVEAILVCEEGGLRKGISVATGLEVPVP